MKKIILSLAVAVGVVGCSEKTEQAMKVLHDKAEHKLIELAGEGDVAIGMYKTQYAVLKERLVKLKTLQKQFQEESEAAYASGDPRRIKLFDDRLKDFNSKIPEAEKTLQEFFEIYQHQKDEIKLLKDEVSTFRASGMLTDNLSITSEYEKRADTIKTLMNELKEKSNRAKSLLEVGQFEETYTKK